MLSPGRPCQPPSCFYLSSPLFVAPHCPQLGGPGVCRGREPNQSLLPCAPGRLRPGSLSLQWGLASGAPRGLPARPVFPSEPLPFKGQGAGTHLPSQTSPRYAHPRALWCMRLHCFCVHTRVCVHVCAVWCVRTVARMHVCENFCLSQISPKAPPASVCGLSVSLSHVHSCVSGCLVLAGVSFAWMCLGLPVMCVLQGSGPCDSTCCPGVSRQMLIPVGWVRWMCGTQHWLRWFTCVHWVCG